MDNWAWISNGDGNSDAFLNSNLSLSKRSVVVLGRSRVEYPIEFTTVVAFGSAPPSPY